MQTQTPKNINKVLREGDFGDEHVKIEDRLISASLRAYDGAEREQVVNLFTSFALFPEDAEMKRLQTQNGPHTFRGDGLSGPAALSWLSG